MLTVADIMRTDVVTIGVDESARALARLLSESEISGVPVVNSHGSVVGVASATDLVRLAAEDSEVRFTVATLRSEVDRIHDPDEDLPEPDPFGFFLPEDSPLPGSEVFDRIPETVFESARVGDLMTPVSFSVTPEMGVPELCEFLIRGRIHRALVVEGDQLLGIVTSHDVLRGIAEQRLAV
jgi:CBS domain-containing protein